MNVRIRRADAITAMGPGLDHLYQGLCQGRTAIAYAPRFDAPHFVSHVAALIDDLEVDAGESRVMAILKRQLAPLVGKLDPATPLVLATTIGEIDLMEQAVLKVYDQLASPATVGGDRGVADAAGAGRGYPDPGRMDLPELYDRSLWQQAAPDQLLQRVKNLLGLAGPGLVVSSACASSATAVAQTAAMIQRGSWPHALLVACDAVTELMFSGFSGLLSLSESPAAPFDVNRDGLSLGEGAGWAWLEPADMQQGQPSLKSDFDAAGVGLDVAVLGWGSSADAFHMTAPDPQGRGLVRAIAKACDMAQIDPGQIDAVIAHGTGTAQNDSMELKALHAALPRPVPTISIKGAIGHTAGATGLHQILTACMAIDQQQLPPCVGMKTPDPDAVDWVHQVASPLPDEPTVLSMNSGFGGVNSVVILKRQVTP